MLDMGFEPQIMKIILDIRPDRQTVMTRSEASHQFLMFNMRDLFVQGDRYYDYRYFVV